MAIEATAMRPAVAQGFRTTFVLAWVFCLLFYFMQYAVRSVPGVMIPELTAAFHLSALGISSLLGVYYYTYSTFAIVSGAALDRWGAMSLRRPSLLTSWDSCSDSDREPR